MIRFERFVKAVTGNNKKGIVTFVGMGVLTLLFSLSSFSSPVHATTTAPITGVASKCMDVQGGKITDRRKVQLYTCNSTNAQAWEQPGDGECTWGAYRNSNLKQATFPSGTPFIINDKYQMGANALNSNMDVEASQVSTSKTLTNTWNIMFPINYSSNGQSFIFDSSEGYDNWSGHGTLHDYYVTLDYKKVN